MKNEILKYEFENDIIEFEIINGNVMVNATQMAKVFNKKVNHFTENETTKMFLDECLNNRNSGFSTACFFGRAINLNFFMIGKIYLRPLPGSIPAVATSTYGRETSSFIKFWLIIRFKTKAPILPPVRGLIL